MHFSSSPLMASLCGAKLTMSGVVIRALWIPLLSKNGVGHGEFDQRQHRVWALASTPSTGHGGRQISTARPAKQHRRTESLPQSNKRTDRRGSRSIRVQRSGQLQPTSPPHRHRGLYLVPVMCSPPGPGGQRTKSSTFRQSLVGEEALPWFAVCAGRPPMPRAGSHGSGHRRPS